MDSIGISFGYLFAMLLNVLLFGGWIILAVLALLQLRRQSMADTARAIWAVLILIIPILGAAAFWIVKPGQQNH